MATKSSDSSLQPPSGQEALPPQLEERVSAIRKQWANLRENWSPDELRDVHSSLSELAEFAGHESFTSLADAAFSAEVYLSSYVGTEIPMTAEQRETVESLLAELTANHTQLDGAEVESFPPVEQDSIYVVGSLDSPLGELTDSLRALGRDPRHLENTTQAHEALHQALPAVLIADVGIISEIEPILEELAHVHKTTGQRIPIAYVSANDDLVARIRSVRAGGEAFFCPPFDSDELKQKLETLENPDVASGRRVLVVEDDPSQAEFAASIVEKMGIETATITDPMLVIKKLREFRPDLILMDIYMPEVNGIELTSVIRGYNEFSSIPIVFLSGEQDTDRQVDALSVGGDDFITKPLRPKQLIAIIENRLRRSRPLERADHISPVLNLLTRSQFLERVSKLLSADPAHTQATGIMLLSPDQSEAMKAQAGEENFEQLIIELAQLVDDQLEERDAIAQVDNGIVGIIVRRSNDEALQNLASNLHESIASHEFCVQDNKLSISIGIGLSFARPDENDTNNLFSQAQVALQHALDTSPGSTVVYDEDSGQSGSELAEEPVGQTEKNSDITEIINRCVRDDEFVVLFQPMLDLQSRGNKVYEMQLRMPTPKGDLLTLAEFRKEAEKHGLANAVDQWVFEHALNIVQKQGTARHNAHLFICQSGASILDPEYPEWIAEQLRAHKMVGTGLVLDIPLRSLSHDPKIAKKHIKMLHKMDIQVCLSWFPEKPAAFKLLRYVNGNYIRIARRLLKADRETIKTIVDEAHEAKAKVIISHIDDPRAIDLHWSSGADLLQGDFIHPAMEEMDYDFAQVVI